MPDADDIRIHQPERGDPVLDQVEEMFADQWAHLARFDPLHPLVDGGAAMWRAGVEKMIGRLGVLFVASRGDEAIGFTYGIIRVLPDYLGGGKYADWPQMHTRASARGTGVGRRLYDAFEQWCIERGCGSIQGYVLSKDVDGMALWEHLGFVQEQVQIRKMLSRPAG
ncbi:MAG TPA: GNAT family N-acetyltransferase [Iamia sp.]